MIELSQFIQEPWEHSWRQLIKDIITLIWWRVRGK